MNARTGIDPAPCAIPYRDLKVIDPDVGHPLKITLNFDADSRRPQTTLLPLSTPDRPFRNESRQINAEVLNVGPAKNESRKIRSHRCADVGSC